MLILFGLGQIAEALNYSNSIHIDKSLDGLHIAKEVAKGNKSGDNKTKTSLNKVKNNN